MERTLNEKLGIIQTELKSKKSRYNSFGKYYFRSAEDILEAIKPFLVPMNLSVRIREELISDNTIKSTAVITDGLSRYKATAIVGVDMNQKGMQTPQKFGTASSYGKKYALGNLFLIDDTQDSDALNTHGSKPTLLAKTPQHKKVIQGLEKGYSIDDVKKKYSLTKEMEQELSKITKSIKV
nr:erf family protein [uncultured Mediterranean phage uvMED]|tara:strand:- start:1355 stop:1897 length:543 start_codon:yes stop_codon:yes gene_type:complete